MSFVFLYVKVIDTSLQWINGPEMAVVYRPVTTLGHQEGRRVFWEGSNFLNYVQ